MTHLSGLGEFYRVQKNVLRFERMDNILSGNFLVPFSSKKQKIYFERFAFENALLWANFESFTLNTFQMDTN